MSNRVPGIYMIINMVNGKHYVGQTNNLHLRCLQHFSTLRSGVHFNRYLQFAFNKHGEDSFVYYIAEQCGLDTLTEREQFWLDLLGRGRTYNLAPVAGTNRGVIRSEEFCRKLSARMKGVPKPPQVRAAVAAANARRVLTDKTKAKLAAAAARKVITDETRAKLSAANKGRPLSEEQKRKLSIARSKMITAFGKTMDLVGWAAESGLPLTAIEKRLSYGWSADDAVSRQLRSGSGEV